MRSPRWLTGALVVVLALAFVECAPQKRRTRKRSDTAPAVSATPRPGKTRAPAPSPTRAPKPERDTSRDPLAQLVTPNTTAREASSLKLGDRARAELDGGTTEKAFELLDTAIEQSPKLAPLYVLRARAFLAEGNADAARADVDRAAALPAPTAWVAETAALRGAVFEVDGNRAEALAAYRRALRINPSNQTAKEALRRLAAEAP
jgi:predicted negative regulator of RcsB-dependent stress response